jgi:hypothetical protein
MRSVSDESCRENQNTHFMSDIDFPKIMPFNELMWKNIVEPDRPQMTIWRVRVACRIPKAADAQSDV